MATVRHQIVTAALWGIANEPQIHYGEIRPIPLARTLPLTTDCSGFVTVCYFLAGAPDPNGLDYSGEGWTGTLLRNLEHGRLPPHRLASRRIPYRNINNDVSTPGVQASCSPKWVRRHSTR